MKWMNKEKLIKMIAFKVFDEMPERNVTVCKVYKVFDEMPERDLCVCVTWAKGFLEPIWSVIDGGLEERVVMAVFLVEVGFSCNFESAIFVVS